MLKLQNVSKYYTGNDVVALGLRKVNLEFKLGEFVAVTGESGSGKSTLLNVISGLDSYEDGEMYVNGEETSYFSIEEWEAFRRQYIGFVFQSYNIIDSYSVLENVMIALTIQGYDSNTRKERALKLIDQVGLSTHIHHKASKLSGGQKQRCVIARALAKDCPIIVADEPTGNLDSESGRNILSLLKEISKNKLVIVVTHSYEQVSEYATRKIRLFDGEVVEDKEVKKFTEAELVNHVESYTMTWINLIGISLRNLFRTPKRTIFTLVVSIFIVVIFTFSYGSYTSETSNINNDFYFGYFNNVSESRIVVTKFGNLAFTPEEVLAIEDIDLVRTVVQDDVIMDSLIMMYYEEYEWIGTFENYLNPADMLDSSQLIDGRLPNSEFEVVIQEVDDYSIGDIIQLGFSYPRWGDGDDSQTIPTDAMNFTIVGTVQPKSANSWRGLMYFHDDFIDSDIVYKNAYYGEYESRIEFTIKYEENNLSWLTYDYIKIDDSIPDGEVYINEDSLYEYLYVTLPGYDPEVDGTELSLLSGKVFSLEAKSIFELDQIEVEVTGFYTLDEEEYANLAMNSNTLDLLMQEEKYQMTVLVLDAYDAEKVMSDLQALGFNTIYPAAVGNEITAIIAIATTIYLGFILGFLMIVIYFISYVVLKNVQNSKKKDYLIFRSIGASKRDLNRVTILELFITTIMAYAITMSLLFVNEFYDTWIPQYLRYFTVGSYLFILLLLSVLSLLLGNRFNKKLFSDSVITSLRQE